MEFIDGITVLSESTTYIRWWTVIIIAVFIGLIIGLFAWVEADDVIWGMATGAIGTVICFLLIYLPLRKPTTEYKVLIDESVSFEEFDKLYEVTGHDGNIVEIRIKERE